MKKRIHSLILAFALLMTLLAGCGQAEGPQPDLGGRHSDTTASVPVSDPANEPSRAVPSNDPHPAASKEAGTGNGGDAVLPTDGSALAVQGGAFHADTLPEYSGGAYAVVHDNLPFFQERELSSNEFEDYSELDSLGRCGVAFANVSPQSMPTEERGSIGQVRPSGWHTIRYDFVDGKYLYNRCHLIGYQLTAENANVKNLITGTRYLNVEGMLPFENMVADYVKETGNHVAYRVTPVFAGENLVASGVLMEGYSIEDQGDGVCFCIFAYNVQPGVVIDYMTGDSQLAEDNGAGTGNAAISVPPPPSATPDIEVHSAAPAQEEPPVESAQAVTSTYIANTNTRKFHYPSCSSVDQMNEANKWVFTGTADELIQQGYVPCKRCRP